jgi:hypothetical protein
VRPNEEREYREFVLARCDSLRRFAYWPRCRIGSARWWCCGVNGVRTRSVGVSMPTACHASQAVGRVWCSLHCGLVTPRTRSTADQWHCGLMALDAAVGFGDDAVGHHIA